MGSGPGDPVASALASVPRTHFLPRARRPFAAFDRPLDIGFGQTNSQPTAVANMLRLLNVQRGHRILDVGSGSAWTTALLAHLVGPSGIVIGVERVPQLVRFGRRNLARLNMPWASIKTALPDVFGLPDEGPFDRILVSADPGDLPQELIDQLEPNGSLVIPVDGVLLKVTRHEGDTTITEHGPYRFVPLRRS